MDVDSIKVGGGGGGYNLDSANPFGGSAPAEAKADGPLEEILVSKNWKVSSQNIFFRLDRRFLGFGIRPSSINLDVSLFMFYVLWFWQ